MLPLINATDTSKMFDMPLQIGVSVRERIAHTHIQWTRANVPRWATSKNVGESNRCTTINFIDVIYQEDTSADTVVVHSICSLWKV